jgi:hypothetical protein
MIKCIMLIVVNIYDMHHCITTGLLCREWPVQAAIGSENTTETSRSSNPRCYHC